MRTALYLVRFTIQASSALALGVIYYLLGMAAAVYEGFESIIGQPIVGLVLSSAAVALLFIVGLPIRLIPSLHRLWLRFWWFPILLGLIAIGCTVLSWQPAFQVTMTHPDLQMEVPCFNPALGYGGWLLAIFAALHFYLPLPLERIADFITRILRRLFGDSTASSANTALPPAP